MNQLAQEVFSILRENLLKPMTTEDILAVFELILPYVRQLSSKERKNLFIEVEKFQKSKAPRYRNLILSYFFYETHEVKYLQNLAWELGKVESDLNPYHFLIWQLLILLFKFQGEIGAKEVFQFREKLVAPSYRNVCNQLSSKWKHETRSTQSSSSVPIKRVAVVLSQFLSVKHAPSKNALILAAGLQQAYQIEAKIINCNCLPLHHETSFFNATIANMHPGLSLQQSITYEDTEFGTCSIPIYTPPTSHFSEESLQQLQQQLITEQFDAVIHIGDNLFITDSLMGHLPIMTISTTRQLPIIASDYLCLLHDHLTPEEEKALQQRQAESGLKGYMLGWSFNAAQEKSQDETLTRAQFNIAEDATVLVVVGNRLGIELSEKFLSICTTALAQNPNNILFFIGSEETLPLLLKHAGLDTHPQIRLGGYQQRLRNALALCDIYLNPFRSGGGNAAQMAVLEHLPVVTLDHCDSAVCIPPEWRCQDESSYAGMLSRLMRDKAYFAEMKTAMTEKAKQIESNQPLIQRMLDILNDLNQQKVANQQSFLLKESAS